MNPKCASSSMMLLMSMLLAGCGASGGTMTFSGWRDNVEKYIDTEGQGDPNVLRNVTWPQSRREFSAIGGEVPQESQDAKGVLVGVSQVGNARWFVFLVGIVNKGVVEDIRIQAMNNAAGRRTWRASNADAAAWKKYRDYHDQLWRARFPGRESAPMQYTTFPKDSDTFDVNTTGGTVTVSHAPSGATWKVTLDPRSAK